MLSKRLIKACDTPRFERFPKQPYNSDLVAAVQNHTRVSQPQYNAHKRRNITSLTINAFCCTPPAETALLRLALTASTVRTSAPFS